MRSPVESPLPEKSTLRRNLLGGSAIAWKAQKSENFTRNADTKVSSFCFFSYFFSPPPPPPQKNICWDGRNKYWRKIIWNKNKNFEESCRQVWQMRLFSNKNASGESNSEQKRKLCGSLVPLNNNKIGN